MFPKNDDGLEGFELPLRLGLIFDTTLVATRLIYSGVFQRYPHFPYILAHTGGALLMALERLDNGYRLFPDCRKYISELPSEYAKRLNYDATAFGQNALMLAVDTVEQAKSCSAPIIRSSAPIPRTSSDYRSPPPTKRPFSAAMPHACSSFSFSAQEWRHFIATC